MKKINPNSINNPKQCNIEFPLSLNVFHRIVQQIFSISIVVALKQYFFFQILLNLLKIEIHQESRVK